MNKIIARLTKKANNLTEGQEKFMQECKESGKFNKYQMEEIRTGFVNGLTMDQVKIFVDPKFNDHQMNQIRKGFENGLSMEQIKLYADPKFTWEQMEEIRYRFENGWTIEEIKNKYKLANRNNKINRIARKLK